ncbi:restriction endonuclease subunit S [Faecalibacterium duncaniae]|uniref:restriction endonuclease subunit S n=1 Tax=Faecalibacterium duncaniae (strain DSM 17677 / JCM 31915 / A2-165) TaxID=411483 RepID=UPI000EDBFB42|nr:restriction endonuclease subunit S [Faecalibacterium duncaniae]MDV5042345.1 restriction endonuclease subunit S [Faecalibacterium duncaniae]HCO87909.1 restriction endonuclease [Lachnospiraceae bacterium]
MAKLGEICAFQSGGTPSKNKPEYFGGEIPWISTTALNGGKINEADAVAWITPKAIRESAAKIVPANSIMVGTRVGIGKVAINTVEMSTSQDVISLIGIDKDKWYKPYLCKLLLSKKDYFNSQARGATIKGIKIDVVANIDVPEIDYATQRKVAATLSKIDTLIVLRKQQLAKLDELVKARFVEMFGDVLLNSMQWPEKTLESMADIVSGITKGRKTAEADLQEVPYMAVSNVKDGYIDWTTVKTILATRQEIEQYRLMPDDILMTEGGDPDKVGRGAIIKVPLKKSIHQNHIFRVRLDEQEVLPSFFAEYLRHQKAKRYFLGCAKQTTGIASINMRQLRALPTLVPPLSLQNQFAAFVERVDQQKQTVQQSLEKLELMKKVLMQEYFG